MGTICSGAAASTKQICLGSWLLVLGSLFFVAVFVVDADQTTSEGQYLAESNENRMVYLRQRWKDKARGKHYAPEGAQCKRCEELNVFSHCIRSGFAASLKVLKVFGVLSPARCAHEIL